MSESDRKAAEKALERWACDERPRFCPQCGSAKTTRGSRGADRSTAAVLGAGRAWFLCECGHAFPVRVEDPDAGERRAFLAGFLIGRKTAPLPDSIAEALNSGDGSYRP